MGASANCALVMVLLDLLSAHQGALEGGDFATKVIQTFQELIASGPGYELSAVKDNEHVGVLKGRATRIETSHSPSMCFRFPLVTRSALGAMR